MPPRKRARHSTTATASPSPQTPSPSKSSPPPTTTTTTTGTSDPWTDAEETALFAGLFYAGKPTGIHKHQRLLALHSWLLENNHIHPAAQHTRPPGIWAKLGELYDLAALDAREDARQLERIEGVDEGGVGLEGEYSEAENVIEVDEFALPVSEDEELRGKVWKRRLRGGDAEEESEVEMPELNLAEEVPRVVDLKRGSDPVEASPRGKKGKAATKGRKGRDTTESRRGSLATAPMPSRRSARQAESTADEQSVDGKQEVEAEAEGEEEQEEGDESEDKESQASTPAARSTRSKGGAAGKAGTRLKGRSRAKAK